VVIGGGVIGLCVALSLQEQELRVTVGDPGDEARSASFGNAGRIAIEATEPLSSLATLRSLPGTLFLCGGPVAFPLTAIAAWLPFGLRLIAASTPARFRHGATALRSLLANAVPAWRRRLAAIGAPELLFESGHYSIWENSRSSVRGRQAWLRDAGCARTLELDGSEMDSLARLIRVPIAGSLKFAGTASIADPADLLAALRKSFLTRGGHWHNDRLSIEGGAAMADIVVVAAGVASAALLGAIGHTAPIIAERGYHIQQAAASWPPNIPPLYFEDRSIVVTQFRSGLRATSFTEFTSTNAPPDPRKWARLRRHAKDLGLPFDERASRWMGSRPTLPDYLPAIGQSRRKGHVFYAFGHQHLGLTLAAFTGELVASLAVHKPSAVTLAPYDVDRFA
jgi:D-amino-acid dehydrogenase